MGRYLGILGRCGLWAVGALPAMGPQPHQLFLDFSDGTESLAKGADDDAEKNISAVAAVKPVPAFAWPAITDGTMTRQDVVRTVARQVHQLYLPYNVVLTTARPAAGPYTLIVIAGAPSLLGYAPEVAGLAFMDCNNEHEDDVVFVFPEALKGNLSSLAVTIAQEAAHALGLEHTTNVMDVMHPRLNAEQNGFPDVDSVIAGKRVCGPPTQNSHRRLLELVGPWAGGDKPLDGAPAGPPPPRIVVEQTAPDAAVVPPAGSAGPGPASAPAGGCSLRPNHLPAHRDAPLPRSGAIFFLLFVLATCPARRRRL